MKGQWGQVSVSRGMRGQVELLRAVDYLGMPVEAMPLFNANDDLNAYKKKAERILKHILKGEPYSKVRDTCAIAKIFPWNTIKFLPAIFFNVNGLKIKERLLN